MNPREDLQTIFLKAVQKVDPFLLVRERMERNGSTLRITGEEGVIEIDLSSCPEVLVLGMGKASARMAQGVEEVLGGRISAGAVVTKHGQGRELRRIMVFEAGHPIPDEDSVAWARELTSMAGSAGEGTLIINLISGGGSALFCLPREGITLEDLQSATGTLLGCGAHIGEINCVRKHLSLVKGGGFARAAYPARMVNLILSDVMGDHLDVIASGITVPDSTTFSQALAVVEKYAIGHTLPAPVMQVLEAGARGEIPETPKPGDPVFSRVSNIILGNNATACRGARDFARELGYHVLLMDSPVTGDACAAGRNFAAMASDLKRDAGCPKPALILAGGETTVKVRGNGKGGRNQEMALAFLDELMKCPGGAEGISFLSAGTDGIDGPTDAAGALVSSVTAGLAVDRGISPGAYLENNDSYHFFQETGGLVITGPTDTNVCDLQLLCVE